MHYYLSIVFFHHQLIKPLVVNGINQPVSQLVLWIQFILFSLTKQSCLSQRRSGRSAWWQWHGNSAAGPDVSDSSLWIRQDLSAASTAVQQRSSKLSRNDVEHGNIQNWHFHTRGYVQNLPQYSGNPNSGTIWIANKYKSHILIVCYSDALDTGLIFRSPFYYWRLVRYSDAC